MNRTELYNKVKELGVAEDIKKKYGKNYTNLSNKTLEEAVASYEIPKSENYDKVIIRLVSTLQAKSLLTPEDAEDVLKMLP